MAATFAYVEGLLVPRASARLMGYFECQMECRGQGLEQAILTFRSLLQDYLHSLSR